LQAGALAHGLSGAEVLTKSMTDPNPVGTMGKSRAV
jgi:hypothetical protein